MTAPPPDFGDYFPSNAKRRFMSTSDEEIEDEMEVRDRSRVGWPSLLTLPLQNFEPSDKEKEPFKANASTMISILRAQAIQSVSIEFFHRCHDKSQISPHTLTALIKAFGSPEKKNAVLAIRRMLKAQEVHFNIELIDFHAYPDYTMHAIASDEASVIQAWKAQRLKILEILMEREDFTHLHILHFGADKERTSCPVTLIIFALFPDLPEWSETLKDIKRLIPFRVTIRYGPHVQPGEDSEGSRRLIQAANPDYFEQEVVNTLDIHWHQMARDEFRGGPHWGSSVGLKGTTDVGTIGGFVQLSKSERILGLTCNHVLQGHPKYAKATNTGERSISPLHPLSEKQQVVVKSPSERDVHLRLSHFEHIIKEDSEQIEKFQAGLSVGREPNTPRRELNNLQPIVADARRDKTNLETDMRSHNTGTMKASSGYRTVEYKSDQTGPFTFALDWALLHFETASLAENRLFGMGRFGVAPNTFTPGRLLSYWRDNIIGESFKVAKRGRTTGWTSGEINALESYYIRTLPRNSLIENYGDGKKEVVSGIIVVNDNMNPKFAESGDSGAIVIQVSPPKNPWIGQLWASGDRGQIGWIIPIGLIFKDIEDITGEKIEDPSKI